MANINVQETRKSLEDRFHIHVINLLQKMGGPNGAQLTFGGIATVLEGEGLIECDEIVEPGQAIYSITTKGKEYLKSIK